MPEQKTDERKQRLKRHRTKRYFLEAVKAMIAAGGVESVSVRKVADVAGYSYATLYNYFEDLNELLWDAKQAMINDIVEYMKKTINDIDLDIDGIKMLYRVYIKYYFENPNIFKFFYFYRLIKPDNKQLEGGKETDYNGMLQETFKRFFLEGRLGEEEIELVGKTCIYAVHGMLMLFFSGNGDLTEAGLYRELDMLIDYLL